MGNKDIVYLSVPMMVGKLFPIVVNFKKKYQAKPFIEVEVWFEKREPDDSIELPYFQVPKEFITNKSFTIFAEEYNRSRVNIHYQVVEIKKVKTEYGTIYA